ncbi:hypothetical protein [Methyloversatilis sp.]|uniref:hypothetical protein n=1 Tax=Methyloversatilis sp. TaxID=2569862 RepID=UPI0035ADC192
MENKLYEFTVRVLRGGNNCDLPSGMLGAYVPCYVSATDHESALKKGVVAVKSMDFIFDDIRGDVREIPLASWADYIHGVWPDFSEHFPAQDELPELVGKGVVFFGPFATFQK